MDYKEIIENAHKYHYYITSHSKCIFLSSSNSNTEAKKLALEKLKPNIDNLINKKIVIVKIKSVADNYKKQKNSDDLKIIGGPIVITIERGLIISPTKITNFVDNSSNTVYLSKKYIKKNIDNIAVDVKKLIVDYFNDNLNKNFLSLVIL